MLVGIAASPGIVRGRAYVCPCANKLAVPRRKVSESELSEEVERFDAAIENAERDLRALQKETQEKLGKHDAEIFEVQILLLHDATLRNEVMGRCLEERTNVEAALTEALEKLTSLFAGLEDPYFRERAADLRDVGQRLLNILLQDSQTKTVSLPEGSIVVTNELLPSLTAQLNQKTVLGLVAEGGGLTAHAVILARSLGIPTLIGVPGALEKIRTNDWLVVDGLAGRVFVNPPKPVLREYDRLEADFNAHQNALKELIDLPAITTDGVMIKLAANIGKSADAAAAALFNADGIGLYRTEFAFLVQDHFPSEDEQYQIYRAAAERVMPKPVVIRALDVGSDKLLPYFPLPPEANPSLGCRGTRLLLAHPQMMRTQLRAVLRLSATHPISVLFPMIGGVEEIIEARRALEAAKRELDSSGQRYNRHIPVGAMIETPAGAITARRIAQNSDFLSVGTNDLVQYLLISDRASPAMAAYYEPLHPAVLQIIKSVVDSAKAEAKEISICGEMAGNPAYIELLLGLGVRTLSASPGEILAVKKIIRSTSIQRAESVAMEALELSTVGEIKRCVSNSSGF
jgi:phosphoenolpyruvate-protein phosphotransferase (PTS system enzyme I)